MASPIDSVPTFLLGWLSSLCRDPALAVPARELVGPLSSSQGPSTATGRAIARGVHDRLATRLATVAALGRRLAEEPPDGSPRATWRRQARQLAASWSDEDPGAWWRELLALSDLGNGLVRGVIASCLAESILAASTTGPVAAGGRRLRDVAVQPYRGLGAPPDLTAPWNLEAYIIPPDQADRVAAVSRVLAAHTPSGADAALRAWTDLADAYSSGWLLPREPAVAALRDLRDGWPADQAEGLALLNETLAAWDAGRESAAPAASPGEDTVSALAVRLLASESPEAQAFGRRLAEADASEGLERSRGLLGCLMALDDRVGRPAAGGPWTRAVRERLAAHVRGVEGCEILDDRLVGQPVRLVADLVTSVGTDPTPPNAQRFAITRVERPGYALTMPGGIRQVLARAQVRVGS